MGDDSRNLWMWLDAGQQCGPLPQQALSRLFQRSPNLRSQLETLMVWKQGMAEWVRVTDVPEFQEQVLTLSSFWYYSDGTDRIGPIDVRELKSLFEEGEIDGLTLLYRQPRVAIEKESAWKPLNEWPTLRDILTEDDNCGANTKEDQDSYDARQVFISDVDHNGAHNTCGSSQVEDGVSGEVDHGEKGDAKGVSEEGKENAKEIQSTVKPKKKKTRKQRGLAWNDKAPNIWVYVSGLPRDVTEEEMRNHFSKCGVLALDPSTGEPRIKMYKDPKTGSLKGDASVAYAKPESVDLAIQVLDGGQMRADSSSKLSVTKAEFKQKGDSFDPSKRQKVSESGRRVAKAAMSQKLAWNEDDDIGMAVGVKGGGLKIVVLEGMFVPRDFSDPSFEHELHDDLVSELQSKVGEPDKITLFSKHVRGIVVVKFKTAFAAEECVKVMAGRFFGGRKLKAYYWDGTTNYAERDPASEKTEIEEEQKRIASFGDWIDDQELPEELQVRVEE